MSFLPYTCAMARTFQPEQTEHYPLSRSKIELFLECPRCFFLDRRHGVGRPDGPPFTLNLAVDALLKKEFDYYRVRNEPHPVMTLYGIDALPFRHTDLSTWRDSPTGIRVLHPTTNLEVFGIVDDIWQHPDGSLAVVDYKATSTAAALSLDDRDGYKRQLEFYQWLLRQRGFAVSDTAYIVYANASKEKQSFDRTLEFSLQVLPYTGSGAWVEDALRGAKECLMHDVVPPATNGCVWCGYRTRARNIEEV